MAIRQYIRARLGSKRILELCSRYSSGERLAGLATEFGITGAILSALLKEEGVRVRGHDYLYVPEVQKQIVVERYLKGESKEYLVLSLGLSKHIIDTILRKAGVKVRNQNEAYQLPFTDLKGRLWYMRSTWEVRFAQYLDRIGAEWEYEKQRYELFYGQTYLPDFWIYHPGSKSILCLVEVKGRLTPKAKAKFDVFRRKYPEVALFVLEEEQLMLLGVLPAKTRAGYPRKHHKTMDEQIIALYTAGVSANVVAKKMGCSLPAVRAVILPLGIWREYREAKRLADSARPEFVPKPCLVEGCSRPNHAYGFCSMHRRRVLVGKVPEQKFKPRSLPTTCGVPECDRKYYGNGMCHKHYQRKARIERTADKVCSEEGCGLKYDMAGLCKKHYDFSLKLRKIKS